jgi:hypothetical protein
MSSRIYIYSTLSSDQQYTSWKPPPPGGSPELERQVVIKGGANVASKFLVTPIGARTEVSEDDLEFLETNNVFKRHVEGGYIRVRKEKVDPEVAVAAGMKQRDQSAPLTPESSEFRMAGAKPMKASTKDAPVEVRAQA